MLKLRIVSPEKVIFDGDVKSVTVPGMQGRFQILDNHAAIISALVEGKVEYATSREAKQFNVEGGFVEVKQNEVNLCVEV
ncbi:ATP synthase subunit epsilon [Prevotella sp. S7-1-8]|uniref:ATP synthase F1 subunit epsilon n=1 Tax=Prevotella sp. S7-1-8 TaxID=1284775 RepID=UPI00050F5B6E|nr:ATP synthase F1 subunit epsilon [Prevotella sp. S7-1-8]KGF16661.1 ATP synthase subunit epsilon [Prevotella sp. S7-1-8]